MKVFLVFLLVLLFHSRANSQVWEEVSVADHEELKAFSDSFSKLDTEAIYRLLSTAGQINSIQR